MSDDESEPRPIDAVDESPAPGGQTTPSEIIEQTKAWSAVAKSFIYVEVSSLILMFSCIGVWSKGWALLAYALSVSVISLVACLAIQTGEYVRPGMLEKVEKPVSLALFFWWAVGTCVITFKGPFLAVSNGYLSAWAGLIFTTHWALNIDTTKFTGLETGKKTLVTIFICGAVELFACIPWVQAKAYLGQAAWGLSAGVITMIICAVLFKTYEDANHQVMKISSIVMFVIWATVAGVVTFDGPFFDAGNGYFGAWGGFFACTYFLQHIMTREDEIV